MDSTRSDIGMHDNLFVGAELTEHSDHEVKDVVCEYYGKCSVSATTWGT